MSQSAENPDGSLVDPSRDMIAQGAANVVIGLFSGIPAGGSVGLTALNANVGATSRWAGVLGGVSQHDIDQALRADGSEADPSQIERAYMERDGSISVIPRKEETRILDVSVADGVQTVRIAVE